MNPPGLPAGLRSSHPVLRVVLQGAAVGAAERQARAAQRGRPAADHQPQPAGKEEHLRPLPLALLHRLPEVPHLRLQILHLRTPRPAARKVSAQIRVQVVLHVDLLQAYGRLIEDLFIGEGRSSLKTLRLF